EVPGLDVELGSAVRPRVTTGEEEGQGEVIPIRRGGVVNDAGLEIAVELELRAGAHLDVGDQSFLLGGVDGENPHRRDGGDDGRGRGRRRLGGRLALLGGSGRRGRCVELSRGGCGVRRLASRRQATDNQGNGGQKGQKTTHGTSLLRRIPCANTIVGRGPLRGAGHTRQLRAGGCALEEPAQA